jgi:ribosomal protein S18 acetylase RimI-like enzyme
MLTFRPYKPSDREAVIRLWDKCGLLRPSNDPLKDIARKSKVRGDLFLVGVSDGEVVSSVMVGYDGHRGWINYLAVSPRHQKQGYGRATMEEAERLLRAEGCPKINLQVRTKNTDALAFYESIGFVRDDAVSMGKRLEDDTTPPSK